jgi:xylose dehydrogenase (NAD/NADP)
MIGSYAGYYTQMERKQYRAGIIEIMTNQAPLRWGLLSTARINKAVIEPIRSSKNSQLIAVASRSQEKASIYASTWDIPRYYASYEALLADPKIDVIYNSLPNSLHAEWSIKALRMGKHVLCEKPLTIHSSDVDEMIRVSGEMGKIVTEAFMYRHHPQTILVKEMIDNDEIGNLLLIRGSFCYINTRPNDRRFDPAFGGGSLWDIGCYPISYARFLVGSNPLEVYGHQQTGPTRVDLFFVGQLSFPTGVQAQFKSSFITPYKVEMEITGERGTITIPEPFKPGSKTTILLQREDRTKTIRIKGRELYSGEIEDMENAILFGNPVRINLQESKDNIATIEALFESASTSMPQPVSGA